MITWVQRLCSHANGMTQPSGSSEGDGDTLGLCAQASALCACMLGVSMGEAGVSIMHDVNHGAGLPNKSARYALGTAMDLVRVSPWVCLVLLPCPIAEPLRELRRRG